MRPLDGIRVLEAGLLVQGPQAAVVLGDWGADVVKVELPDFGDPSRWLPLAADDPRSAWYEACNRGKRSVTLDLRVTGGREAFLRLAETADVVITNFTSGTMDGWGLGYDALADRNPRIVYASGSTYGEAGPGAAREGADLSGQAAGGLISTTGVDGSELTPVAITIADHIASQNLLSGIVAALFARERTGRGQRVDVSLIGGQIWAQASEYTGYLLTGRVAGRSNRGHPLIPGLYAVFPTADGWIAIVGAVGEARTRFYEEIGRPELAEQFPQPLYFDADKAALFPRIDEAMCTRTTAEWCERFTAAGLRHAPVRDHADVAADPSVWDNGYLVRVEADDGGRVGEAIVNSPVHFSETPGVPGHAVPELGQHTEEVLLETGYGWDDITELRDTGAI